MTLRGSYSARIDDRNRLKVPAEFRRVVETTWGNDVFVTSLTGRDVQIYPLQVWEEFEAKLMKLPPLQPARTRIQKVINYYGQMQQMDSQGRVLIHSPLKDDAAIAGEVTVLGYGNYLHVQNAESIRKDVAQSIEADLETLSQLWRND